LPLYPRTNTLIHEYLAAAGHDLDDNGALFRPIKNNTTGKLEKPITADGVYKLVRAYSAMLGFEIGAHALRATAATNALDNLLSRIKLHRFTGWPQITMPVHRIRWIRPYLLVGLTGSLDAHD
jgi:integrase